MTFEGKTVAITGAAAGIGQATTRLFATRGAHVIAIDRDAEALSRLDIKGITPLQGDVTDPNLPAALKARITALGGPLAVLVNNAGIGGGGRMDQTSDDDLRSFFEINVLGLFRLARFAVTEMQTAGGGSIVNVASIYAEVGAQNSAGYSTSKGAVAALTRQMATDYGHDGIRVNAVAPGLIETPLTEERIRTEKWRHKIFVEQCPLQRVGQPDDVARAIAFLASDEAAFISGEILRVDGGWAMGRFPREAQL
ncbi:SDR family NAD(P)-dependent oxidoreductase [Lentibacter sp. XHP0401]|uniref:SDR family NAD(P)-dependent oxidoreductase n=1 Tax=Lentibacter sp. XHP0401 TaxID=2984334 RepID=UPI0021E8A747|nr:SDR family oxidoreductase [Lentibacter sp. XHP0401]MCV2894306.1 SDR family oxidoreductase [Lentibacter sp. XHP0401]